ncbi:TPR repeat-containing protein [Legionella quinlivanii]|uniref:TPR repeat-containing protein n=1 Tax=Legionella quinlivanii TaxID=45073 RepID=A0A0W0XU54_9GAMM|nr:tetratricopeptide repeat protein [Legionella quinlivanii]KTD48074.1 TPR repeat-containing protein [Legionella quinlivanii]SEG48483.1 TPR repeat [Legionella quinlivanii DSM 21216]STY49792.1 TPR repeat protein, protein-protein interaction [Legionella quinlivanii]
MPIHSISLLINQALKGKINAYELLIQQHDEKKISVAHLQLIHKEISAILPTDPRYSSALTLRGIINQWGVTGIIDINLSINLFEQAIELNNNMAMYCLAKLFYVGTSSLIDYPAVIELLKRSSDLNNPKASFQLGKIYQNGWGNINANIDLAIEFYDKAIDLNWTQAMIARAELFKRGLGGPVNINAARNLYQRAAALNNRTAILHLARMHRQGIDGVRNFSQAIQLYTKAASLNCPRAMMELGSMFEKGQGAATNLSKAIELYYKAYCLLPRMSPTQLIEACIKSNAEKSKQILFTLYLDKGDFEKISELFISYPNYLIQLLYNRIIYLLDFEVENELRQALINLFVTSDSECLIHLSKLKYLEFKLELQANNRENALKVYSTYLAQRNDLSANDYYRLGNLELAKITDLSPERQVIRINQACIFYYKAYKKGDFGCYRLIVNLQREIQKEEDSLLTDQMLFNRFVDLIPIEQNDLQKKHIIAFETFVIIEKNKLKRRRSCCFFNSFTNNFLSMAEKILNQLQHNIPLAEIIEGDAELAAMDKQSDLYLLAQSLICETPGGENYNENDSLLQPNDQLNDENSIFKTIFSMINSCMESRGPGGIRYT